jgi:hypothetical protein
VSALKRSTLELDGSRYWLVAGDRGAISWERLTSRDGATHDGAIGVHSPRPLPGADEPLPGCPFLEVDCYAIGEFLPGGELGEAWRAAGEDDAAVWTVLEDWYRTHLAGGAA